MNRFDLPGYREAVEAESNFRDAAFVDELTTSICGIPIRQMTPADYLVLDGIGSPFLHGRPPKAAEVADFLWKLSPDYQASRLARWRFARRCRRLPYPVAVSQIRRYLAVTFLDSPGGSGEDVAGFAGWCAHLVDILGSEYGLDWPRISRTPLRQIYQLLKCVKKRKDREAVVFNPLSEAVIRQHRDLQQQRLNLLTLLAKRTQQLDKN